MTTSADIIADSIAPSGVRLTTFKLVYPRFIHAEFMTHRMFSRNASSSRAIPVARMLDGIEREPAEPCHWGANQAGMQARAQLPPAKADRARAIWHRACAAVVSACRDMNELGVHKQVANRLNEPFQHMNVVCTGTDAAYDNFLALRCHPDAEPNIRKLAWEMADARERATPARLEAGQWHLPFVDDADLDPMTAVKCSVARCARVSYRNHDGSAPDAGKDLDLYERLVKSERPVWEPGHMSPTEHQARAHADANETSGNFRGWVQYRKMMPNEAMGFDYADACRRWR